MALVSTPQSCDFFIWVNHTHDSLTVVGTVKCGFVEVRQPSRTRGPWPLLEAVTTTKITARPLKQRIQARKPVQSPSSSLFSLYASPSLCSLPQDKCTTAPRIDMRLHRRPHSLPPTRDLGVHRSPAKTSRGASIA